ncbi:ubiquitin-like-specific protease 1D isoform X3 [Panicum virgatum]|uniref:ubiquitin-like-specific protease 1D isoform X3 n=1 Tax=Panicum virgatum TaxID=38727 RepID=UPI0019D6763B|nr:ubiquitin-like-specific protease 1D isoform X3 [Panicum virgatum]
MDVRCDLCGRNFSDLVQNFQAHLRDKKPGRAQEAAANGCHQCEHRLGRMPLSSSSAGPSTRTSTRRSTGPISGTSTTRSPRQWAYQMSSTSAPEPSTASRRSTSSRGKNVQVVLLDTDTSIERDGVKVHYPSRYLWEQMPSISRIRGNYHIFNTYFFNKLEDFASKGSEVDSADCFLKLRRWWKGVDIFRKDYILFPVHADAHWSLVIVCMPAKEDHSGPMVLHLDSLKGQVHQSKNIFIVVDRFLKTEWMHLNGKNLTRKIVKKSINVPQQENGYDCGLFALFYMERFIQEAPDRFCRKDLSMFGKRWFRPEEASELRKKMFDLLLQLFEKDNL